MFSVADFLFTAPGRTFYFPDEDLGVRLLWLVSLGLRAWALWLLLVRPPLAGARWVRVLRILLYANIVAAILMPVIRMLPEWTPFLLSLLNLPIMIMLPLTFRGAPLPLRAIVVGVGGGAMALSVLQIADLAQVASVIWLTAVVLFQAVDRARPVVFGVGLLAVAHGVYSHLAIPTTFTAYAPLEAMPPLVVVETTAVISVVWHALTADELGRERPAAPPRPWPVWLGALVVGVLVAVGLVLLAPGLHEPADIEWNPAYFEG